MGRHMLVAADISTSLTKVRERIESCVMVQISPMTKTTLGMTYQQMVKQWEKS